MFKKLLIVAVMTCLVYMMLPQLYSIARVKKYIASQSYQDGDIIFQSSKSRQCEAVKYATHSDISHCAILFNDEGTWYVLEAVEPVQKITLSEFIRRGTGQHYTIKRMKDNSALNDTQVKKMRAKGNTLIGKHYDIYFNWNNSEIYCSELVWKLYQEAGIELCKTKKLKDFDLTNPLVIEMMKKRYGSKIPYEEAVVAPSDIYHADNLKLVEEK